MLTHSERRDAGSGSLNLVFHDLTADGAKPDEYSVPAGFYAALVRDVTAYAASGSRRFSRVRVYFDDADRSIWTLAHPLGLVKLCEHVIAVPTAWIGAPGRLNREEIVSLQAAGFRIAAHGVTHSPLAVYSNGDLLSTPQGGPYARGRGKRTQRLREREVLYEIRESLRTLEELVGTVEEFVLPYGLYNRETLQIAKTISEDLVISSTDGGFDDGGRLRHRVIVTTETRVETVITGPVHPSGIRQLTVEWT